MEGVVIMSNVDKAALELHKENQGKLEIVSKVDLGSSKDLTLAYTPGVAAPCLEIRMITTRFMIIQPNPIW